MSQPRSEPPQPAYLLPQRPDACPRLALLIHYALGKAAGVDLHRVEDHLRAGNCNSCQRWVDRASRLGQELSIQALGQPSANDSSLASSSPPVDSVPLLDAASWRSRAFTDLEDRLRLLEER